MSDGDKVTAMEVGCMYLKKHNAMLIGFEESFLKKNLEKGHLFIPIGPLRKFVEKKGDGSYWDSLEVLEICSMGDFDEIRKNRSLNELFGGGDGDTMGILKKFKEFLDTEIKSEEKK